MQFIRWSHKIEGTSGAALWLRERGNQSKFPLNTHVLHPPESGHFPTRLGNKSLGECHSFPLSSQQVLNTITCEGKPHGPLDLPSFMPAKETAVNDKKLLSSSVWFWPIRKQGVGLATHPPSWLCRNALQMSSFCTEMTGKSPCSEDSLQGIKEAKLFTGELRPRSDVFKFLILSSRQC